MDYLTNCFDVLYLESGMALFMSSIKMSCEKQNYPGCWMSGTVLLVHNFI